MDREALPNRDVMLSEEALDANTELVAFLAQALGAAATSDPAVVDSDIAEALDALVRTHRTLQSGLFYESVPPNPLAGRIYGAMEESIAGFRQEESEKLGVHRTRESTILGVLVFFQHFEISFRSGRPRGRSFLDALLQFYSAEGAAESGDGSSLILP